ncbi:hypothetical protein MA16_Dca024447 [Dendrobium catenatum]|uniref:Uncharacterized protein n=1 Tax=Dendrobium catenatum TaxID=906689 RepID=A0A2I0V9Q7_9ASPA|nr:hypothetical protein MA16_Dca024447 [Dendrobium catenatum]
MIEKDALEDNQKPGDKETNSEGYGPWMMVNYRKKNFSKNWNNRTAAQNIAEQSNADGTAKKFKEGGTLEKVSKIAVNNSFNALVDLEEGELMEPSLDDNLGEGIAVKEVKESIEIEDNKKILLEADSVCNDSACAGINGIEGSTQSTKKKKPKQLRDLGPINASTRSRRMEMEGKDNLGSNPHNPF